jgi:transcriptional regulator with XRE-family HTH domain
MNPIERFEAEFNDPYAVLHDELARNDDNMVEALVAMRKRKKLSQDTVASRMHRSKTAVSNFERLGADPHLSTIRRYAAAVGAFISSHVKDFDAISQFDPFDRMSEQAGDATVTFEVRVPRPRDQRDVSDKDLPLSWSAVE